jgi:hypothetical protein
MKIINQIMPFIIMFFILSSFTAAQDARRLNGLHNQNQRVPAQNVFTQIEEAILNGDVRALAGYLGPQTYFSLTNGKSGYYSSNQAYYVLEDFFKLYRVTSFRLNNIQPVDNNPYATGVYSYELKGKRNNAQVYISLKYAGKNWQISQITIN